MEINKNNLSLGKIESLSEEKLRETINLYSQNSKKLKTYISEVQTLDLLGELFEILEQNLVVLEGYIDKNNHLKNSILGGSGIVLGTGLLTISSYILANTNRLTNTILMGGGIIFSIAYSGNNYRKRQNSMSEEEKSTYEMILEIRYETITLLSLIENIYESRKNQKKK